MKDFMNTLCHWQHPKLYELLDIKRKSKKIKVGKKKTLHIRRMGTCLVWLTYDNMNKGNAGSKVYLFMLIPK